jgi:ABC-type sugar transport system permease subunit
MLVTIYTAIDLLTDQNNPVMSEAYNMLLTSENYDKSSAMLWFYFVIVGVIVAIVTFAINRLFVRRWEN